MTDFYAYPNIWAAIKANPAVCAAYNDYQDDGFGELIDTIGWRISDRTRACYLFAFIERENLVYQNPLFYGTH